MFRISAWVVNCSCDCQFWSINQLVGRFSGQQARWSLVSSIHWTGLRAAIFSIILASLVCIFFNLTLSSWQSAPTKFESIEQSASFQKIAGLRQVRLAEHLLVSKVAACWRWTWLQKLQSIRHLLDHTIERKQITQNFLKSTIKHFHSF